MFHSNRRASEASSLNVKLQMSDCSEIIIRSCRGVGGGGGGVGWQEKGCYDVISAPVAKTSGKIGPA